MKYIISSAKILSVALKVNDGRIHPRAFQTENRCAVYTQRQLGSSRPVENAKTRYRPFRYLKREMDNGQVGAVALQNVTSISRGG